MNDQSYAGDLSPQETWDLLKADANAVLVDVRTDAEFSFVGVTDLSALEKEPLFISWKLFPSMDLNGDFTQDLAKKTTGKDQALLFLCRSGVRSMHAAMAMTALGYTKCYNITGGFEGDKDSSQHRATHNGWKHAGLPWVQD